MTGYDLHTHTLLSDGTTTPEENVAMALDLGLEGLGVTDHDTIAAHERALAAAADTSLEIVPGTELSAELDGNSIHVLGYWFDPTDEELAGEMRRLAHQREERAEGMVGALRELGVPVEMERVRQLAAGAPIGRPHVARAVVEAGAADNLQQVFDTWLRDGGPAYVPKYAVDPVRAVELIVGAGGVAVVAHPGLYGTQGGRMAETTITAMTEAGMAGIEADHPDHDAAARERYRKLAAHLDLVVTAGSDFHGARKTNRLGQATTPRERVELLRARCA